ncbi:MAG: CopG family transcriptional regulator [Candidatus Aminicenantes bacterium]|nr:CopG family transcriptional regulator [Candidatus Aminicenantes bacterium]
MSENTKRYTVYLQEDLHRALKVKAAETGYSVSDLVNNAVRLALREDAEDLAAFEERKNERIVSFEDVVKKLKADGKL